MKKSILGLMMKAIMLFFVAGCSPSSANPVLVNKTFVLVHGAWQAPFVWDAVKDALEKKKQKVIIVELPAHGDDYTSPAAFSMDVYRDQVIAAIKNIKGKIVLVGHSMGGVVVTAVAEKMPEKI